jgi:hypothetical protein
LDFLQRYLQGDCDRVWSDLVAIGSDGREAGDAVVREFVNRAAENLMRLRDALTHFGFTFENPESVVVPATGRTRAAVDDIEERLGQLPLVLKHWWEVLHGVDFTLKQGSPKHVWRDYDGFVLDRDTLYVVSPREALALALDHQREIREHNIRMKEIQKGQAELLDRYLDDGECEPFLPLGPCASNCDPKGFELPCLGIDGFYFDDGDGETTFGEDFRRALTGPGVYFSPGLQRRERQERQSTLQRMREKIAALRIPL